MASGDDTVSIRMCMELQGRRHRRDRSESMGTNSAIQLVVVVDDVVMGWVGFLGQVHTYIFRHI